MGESRVYSKPTLAEEIANAVSHGIGALLAIAGTAVMVVFAAQTGDVASIVSSSIYGGSLILLFLMSTLYHAFSRESVKRIFQKFDHCSIFLLILGSYAPICLSLLGGRMGYILFGFNAGFTLLGIVVNSIDVKRWQKLSLVIYLLMGWSVVFCLRPLLRTVPPSGFALLLSGGLMYTVGIIFYKAKHIRFMHSIRHLFVLAGSVLHYLFMLFYIILPV